MKIIDKAYIIIVICIDSWWLKHLDLKVHDRNCLSEGLLITDKIINAAQKLLSQQFPHVSSLQSTLLGQKLMFLPLTSANYYAVQILHTGTVFVVFMCMCIMMVYAIYGITFHCYKLCR